jgi:hypothetical protein
MIKEIDKYCPQEGMPNSQIDIDPEAINMTNMSEQLVLLPQLGIHGEGPT